jgi:hypothetical protein
MTYIRDLNSKLFLNSKHHFHDVEGVQIQISELCIDRHLGGVNLYSCSSRGVCVVGQREIKNTNCEIV